MPYPPSVGDTIHYGDDDQAPVKITHRSWVETDTGVLGVKVWTVECSAR
jgi:hypothetical protein